MNDTPNIEFAIVGLGQMGGNLARQALEKGLRVVGNTKNGVPDDLIARGVVVADEMPEIMHQLARPRIVLLYIPAGAVVDEVLDQLCKVLEPDDVIVDGGNSYWGDSVRRHERLAAERLRFVDAGTSGGISGARHGASFMCGGEREAVATVEPVLRALSVDGGYVHAGPPGAGHFVKLVHNGIEFGMLQAIGEGIDLLERFPESIPVADVLECWRHGTVIRSWLVDLMAVTYREKDGLSSVPPYVEDTGEVNWLVDDALRMEVPVPVITQSTVQLLASRDDRRNWARAIAMMRRGFGGHPLGADEKIASKRKTSRVGGFPDGHARKSGT